MSQQLIDISESGIILIYLFISPPSVTLPFNWPLKVNRVCRVVGTVPYRVVIDKAQVGAPSLVL